MKSAFTMIELIFVMVIIGILAAVGIPKLAIARNDATASVIATRLSNCIDLASKGYLTNGIFDVNDSNCVEVVTKIKCYTLAQDDDNGTLEVTDESNATDACVVAQKVTFKNGLSSSDGVLHTF